MTWGRAVPILAVCFVFDALRFVCGQFWFIGPALAAAYCTAEVSSALPGWAVGAIGTSAVAAGCSAIAGAAGYFGSPVFTALGVIMGMAVGLIGWLTVGLAIIMTNTRLFTEHSGHSLWVVISLLISETPIIGSLPALTVTIAKLYHTQIKTDKENLKKYQKENASSLQQERRQQAVEYAQARIFQQTEIEALNDARYAEAQNEDEIPEDVRRTT